MIYSCLFCQNINSMFLLSGIEVWFWWTTDRSEISTFCVASVWHHNLADPWTCHWVSKVTVIPVNDVNLSLGASTQSQRSSGTVTCGQLVQDCVDCGWSGEPVCGCCRHQPEQLCYSAYWNTRSLENVEKSWEPHHPAETHCWETHWHRQPQLQPGPTDASGLCLRHGLGQTSDLCVAIDLLREPLCRNLWWWWLLLLL